MGSINLPKNSTSSSGTRGGDLPSTVPCAAWNLPTFEDILQGESARVMHVLREKLPAELIESPGLDSLETKVAESLKRHFNDIYDRNAAAAAEAIADSATAVQAGNTDAGCQRYTSEEIIGLMNSFGGEGLFNAGEIEKNAADVHDLESHTNKLLSHKDDAAAFCGGDTWPVVKRVFRDNTLKPRTVVDVKLAINIPDSELIDSVLHQYALTKYIMQDLAAGTIIKNINKEIDSLGGPGEPGNINEFFEKICGAPAEIESSVVSPPDTDMENIRSRGFGLAVNALTAILDASGLSYQFIENNKNDRELIIREYEDTDTANLPDEHYQIRLKYIDRAQLADDRQVYDTRFSILKQKVQHLWNLMEVIYQDSKSIFKVNDFEDLARKNKHRIKAINDNVNYDTAADSCVEMRARFAGMRERLRNMYDFMYPVERRVMAERLARLETEYTRFDGMINPYHVENGLLVEIAMTSIKRKKTTLDSMSRVLNEFLRGVCKGFQNAALAVFGRPKVTLPGKALRRK